MFRKAKQDGSKTTKKKIKPKIEIKFKPFTPYFRLGSWIEFNWRW